MRKPNQIGKWKAIGAMGYGVQGHDVAETTAVIRSYGEMRDDF